MVLSSIKKVFSSDLNDQESNQANSFVGTKTYTYFIPSPPLRKTGYREREYDLVMERVLSYGFDIISLNTQAIENGMWVIALLGAKTKESLAVDLNEVKQDLDSSSHSSDIILEHELDGDII